MFENSQKRDFSMSHPFCWESSPRTLTSSEMQNVIFFVMPALKYGVTVSTSKLFLCHSNEKEREKESLVIQILVRFSNVLMLA